MPKYPKDHASIPEIQAHKSLFFRYPIIKGGDIFGIEAKFVEKPESLSNASETDPNRIRPRDRHLQIHASRY